VDSQIERLRILCALFQIGGGGILLFLHLGEFLRPTVTQSVAVLVGASGFAGVVKGFLIDFDEQETGYICLDLLGVPIGLGILYTACVL